MEGDRNIGFFHYSVKIKMFWNRIYSIKDQNGNVLTKEEGINKEALWFFSTIFAKDPMQKMVPEYILEVIFKCVSDEQNEQSC